ncbi:lytic transglycosylase domain-containing protein [bacterium]|nr:lytic transglycosylase domain-containing protein [bacterium]
MDKTSINQRTVWQLLVIAFVFLALALGASSSLASDRKSQRKDNELRDFLQAHLADTADFDDKFDAEVWMLSMASRMNRYRVSHDDKMHILKTVYREAKKAELQPDLVLAVMEIESAFNRYAISRVGAQGLMQVMPFWKNEIGRPDDNLTNIDTNIRYGCTILKFYLNKEKGNMIRALARYNGSLGRTVYPEKVLVAWERHWRGGRL